MNNNKFNPVDEIDLLEIFYILWEKKFKIIGFILISVLLMIGYQAFNESPSTVITEIEPISASQSQKYRLLNAQYKKYNQKNKDAQYFNKITPSELYQIFLRELKNKTVFMQAMHNFKVLDVNKYKDQKAYDLALEKLASNIKISSPIDLNDKKQNAAAGLQNWTIEFETKDTEKWLKVLSSVNILANQDIQKFLASRFENTISLLKTMNEYQINDYKKQLNYLLLDYHRTTEERLAFLNEQALIARKLDISKSTLQTENISLRTESSNVNNTLANINTDRPFYMNGYIAIEEEIKVIESRGGNKKIFIAEHLPLEKKIRAIELDQTVNRIETIFSSTPIIKNDVEFSAAFIATNLSKVKSKNIILGLLMAALIGGLIGVIYVLILAIETRLNK